VTSEAASKGVLPETSNGQLREWLPAVGVVALAAWVIWNMPSYMLVTIGGNANMQETYRTATWLDWVILALLPVVFIHGVLTVQRSHLEYAEWGVFDRVSVFIGRVTMLLVVLMVSVMIFEVVLRYVFERPTLWANELTLWIAGFLFLFAGLYAMQQRSHIAIYLGYDLMPRWAQRLANVLTVIFILLFNAALIWGGWGEAKAQFLRWETFGTAFDPPIPATLSPMILIVVTLVSIQAVSNLIRDWNREPEHHSAVDEVDPEEIAAIKRALGRDD
jgi:TRAP-type mannitol/chloroaromatic compound transport system permease small subunit